MSYQTYIERYLPQLETELRACLEPTLPQLAPFFDMMRYHMGWLDAQFQPTRTSRGKQLRPVFCLLTCEAVGGNPKCALPAAAAVELLHNFSLIHDDVEDNSSQRRHRATVWKLWGMPHGVNCGDAMFTTAFLALGRLSAQEVSDALVLQAHQVFAQTCLRLTEGQYLDMDFETRMDIDTESYLLMISNKTAALISCAMHLGALIGKANKETVMRYAQAGEYLGLTFQIIDDILGIWGDQSDTGKSASSDILTRKKTLPVIYALDDPELQALYTKPNLDQKDITAVMKILEDRDARGYAEHVAQDYANKTRQTLEHISLDSPAHQAILSLSHTLLQRTH